MRYLTALFFILVTSCGDGGSPFAPSAPLSTSECESLVHRETDSLDEGAPIKRKLITACQNGRGHYTRSYLDCVLQSKYSSALDCAYAARGIDRAKREPWLKDRKLGEDGGASGFATMVVGSTYRGKNPRTTINPWSLDLYLDKRDRAFRNVGQNPPDDRHSPRSASASSFDRGGKTYWVVNESYVELQLVKTMVESRNGITEVTCARFGEMERPRPDEGFCAALIKKYLDEPTLN